MTDAQSSPGWRALQDSQQEAYDEITERIYDALDRLRKDPPPCKLTQENLAKLADVSRRTLHNRKWPVDELKRIKDEQSATVDRGSSKQEETLSAAPDQQIQAESNGESQGENGASSSAGGESMNSPDEEGESVEDLREKIVNYQDDNLQLFYEAEALREEVEQLQRQCEMLTDANEQLRREKNESQNGRQNGHQ